MHRIDVVLLVFVALFVFSMFLGVENKSARGVESEASVLSDGKTLNVFFFYGTGCPHCAKVEPFLANMAAKYPIQLNKYDIYTDRSLMPFFDEYCDKSGIPEDGRGVPTVFVADTYFVGDGSTIDGFEEAIKNALAVNQASKEKEPANVFQENLSDAAYLSIFTITMSALADAVSPCSIAILVFLVGARVLVSNFRKRALKVGLAFCSSIFIAYFLFGIGLLNVVQFTGFSGIFSLLVGLVAFVIGVLYLKDAFWNGKGGFAMEVPRSLKPLLMKMLKGVTSPFGAFLMGFVVVSFELPCTGGPYLYILGQLANASTRLQTIPVLLYYNFIFVSPLIMITLLLYSNVVSIGKLREWTEKNTRSMRLLGGMVMLALGFLAIPTSQLIQFIQLFLFYFKIASPIMLASFAIYYVIHYRVKLMRSRLLVILIVFPLITPAVVISNFVSSNRPMGMLDSFASEQVVSVDSTVMGTLSASQQALPEAAATATNISSCTTISTSGEYVLSADIIDSTSKYCINITASHVILDGAHHYIDGVKTSNSYGIYVHNPSLALRNVSVQNVKVQEWYYGIVYDDVQKSITIESSDIHHNYRGIMLLEVSNARISSNFMSGYDNYSSWDGIYLLRSNYNTISNNNVDSWWYNGIYLQDSIHNSIIGNTVYNQGHGIYLADSSDYNLIQNNSVTENQYGISLEGTYDHWDYGDPNDPKYSSDFNTIRNNTITSSFKIALVLNGHNNNVTSNSIKDQVCYEPLDFWGIGFQVFGDNNTIYDNFFRNCGGYRFGYYGGFTGNTWNTTIKSGKNIMGGPFIGGNYWSGNTGCVDVNGDFICDSSFTVYATPTSFIDYLPLRYYSDQDADGVPDPNDNCLNTYNPSQSNSDGDAFGDACDNCWQVPNNDQADTNKNCPAKPYGSDPKCGDICEAGEVSGYAQKTGSSGYGSQNFMSQNDVISYTIRFENRKNATGSIEKIVITDALDSNLNWSTLSLGEMSHPQYGSANFNGATGLITWAFNGIGLPPNKNPPEGEGWVKFTVKSKQSVSSGTKIRNTAAVTFDSNPSFQTSEVLVTIDSQAPSSSVNELPTLRPKIFEVSWLASDDNAGSGVKDCTIYVSDNNGPYAPWLTKTTSTSASFTGEKDHKYSFYSVCTDNVGNTEQAPAQPDTTVTIDADPPTTQHDYDGLVHINNLIITLTATDAAGVSDTYYKINGQGTQTVSINGQPQITTEGNNNTLEFWSIDKNGNEELPHKVLTEIKFVKRDSPILIR